VRQIDWVAGAGGVGEGICKRRPGCGICGCGGDAEGVNDLVEVAGEASWAGGVEIVISGMRVRDLSFLEAWRIWAIGDG